MEARDGEGRRVTAGVGACQTASNVENYSGAWRRVEGPMKTIFHRKADRRDYFQMVQSVV